ncbi:MAG TPA: methyltransferase domain-containing protein [Candidatus Acidoferrum sp.]|nr:methyltransferase domain-containing protein [Candidatus Acidoferrum sp.]
MKSSLLPYLVCRDCQTAMKLQAERTDGTEILEGKLVCAACDRIFPISRGVPRMLSTQLNSAQRATAEAFGYEWIHYSELTDADQGEFLDWIKPLTPSSFAGRVVLDAGCGKGRHIFLASQFQAREVIGIDLSDAVDAAYANTRHLPNVHVVQADILKLPFAAPFDLVYSIGVLHHLPDPKQGFLSLTKHIRPGGQISIWVYGKEGNGWIERFVNPFRLHVTSRAPKLVTRGFSFGLALPLYVALKLFYGPVQRSQRLRWLKSHAPYGEYLCAISDYTFAENFWNVFDHLVAPTAFYHRREEVEDWFAASGVARTEISQRNRNSWRAIGTVPEGNVLVGAAPDQAEDLCEPL